jgi:hypothetical protein
MKEIDLSNVPKSIAEEVMEDDSEVRKNFINHFSSQIDDFIIAMSSAYHNWKEFDANIGTDMKKAHISALIYSAINSHIISMKIFLSGYIVPAGNLQRQVLETIALALLCSNPRLKVLDRFMKNNYSTHEAVKDVSNNYQQLNLNKTAVQVMKRSQIFYHKYSHPSLLSLASLISFSRKGKLYLGASFDDGKINEYTKEINGRVSLANLFDNIIDGIKINIEKWKKV